MTRRFTLGAVCVQLVLLACAAAQAQTVDDVGTWGAFFGQGKIRDHGCEGKQFKWWFDGHARFLDDAGGFNQSIVRPGIGYTLNDNAAIWAGYGWIHTSPLSAPDFDENRIWQQLTWSKKYDPIKFAFRSRLEQRFLETGQDLGWRFRQLVRAQHDLPWLPHFTLVAWDELFIHLNDTDWGAESGFNQNRIFAGIGFKPSTKSNRRVEIGYLNQAIHIPTGDDRSHHILSINFYYSP